MGGSRTILKKMEENYNEIKNSNKRNEKCSICIFAGMRRIDAQS